MSKDLRLKMKVWLSEKNYIFPNKKETSDKRINVMNEMFEVAISSFATIAIRISHSS